MKISYIFYTTENISTSTILGACQEPNLHEIVTYFADTVEIFSDMMYLQGMPTRGARICL
jgi:hypothetical protein